MSAYLVEQIAARLNIEVVCDATAPNVSGDNRVETVSVARSNDGSTVQIKASALFIFIGASPRTPWLPPQIAKDERGFVITGPALGDRHFATSDGDRGPYLYETSVPGVFAVGDVRFRSIKRVASAVGEGSVAVQFMHQFLHS